MGGFPTARGCLIKSVGKRTDSGTRGGVMDQMKRIALAAALLLLPILPQANAAAEDPPATVPAPAQAVRPGAAAAGSSWNAEVAPAGSKDGMSLDVHQVAIVNKVSTYFSNLETLKGRFVQIGADNKRMRGKFFLKRPGRFRFDYARPSRQIVISDGRYLAIQDLDLGNEDRLALNDTPFRLVLRSDVDLMRDAHIMEVRESDDTIVVGLQDKDPETVGQIKLFLSTKPELELKEWITRDAQGLDTRVAVSNLSRPEKLDSELFRIKSPGKPLGMP